MQPKKPRWSKNQLSMLEEMDNDVDLRRELMAMILPRGRRCTHEDFCEFRRALLSPSAFEKSSDKNPFPCTSEFARKWIRGETAGKSAQLRFREDSKAFVDPPLHEEDDWVILDGDWRGPANGAADAITGAILDGCLDCLHYMAVNGLLPGGEDGGPTEYNCTGYAFISIALAGEVSVMQDDYQDEDLVPYREILQLLIARQHDVLDGPMVPSTILPNGTKGKPIFEVALESRVSTETLEILARWFSGRSRANWDDYLRDILRGHLGFELCRRANKFLVEWARELRADLVNSHTDSKDLGEGTGWHALCQNPLADTLFGDFETYSKQPAGKAVGGRIPLYDAIKRNRPDLVEWFLKPERQPQNTWDKHRDRKGKSKPSAIELAIKHNHPEAALCLHLMMEEPNHLRIMRKSSGGSGGYRAKLARKLLDRFLKAEKNKRKKAKKAGISPEILDIDIRRLKYITSLKFEAIFHGVSPENGLVHLPGKT
ncbi:hypothetical protein PENSTE_c001G00050 [Penicillium steckii]|uniref:Uncharacterized protein n=1 Tax=Penicillium steckii TaxID=303698 RepID=A0A1V6U0E1_9EURO|nr:hypothetical protein PENSTE_c001G00050 [Penicillium steckii]